MGPELIDAKLYPMCPTIRDLFSVAERFNTVIQMPEPGDASYGILQTNIPQARKLLVEYVRRLLKEGDAQEIVAAMDAETDRIAEEKYRAVVPDEERAELLKDIMRTPLCPEDFKRRMDGICVRGNFYSDVAAELGVPEIAIRRLFGIEEGHDLILVRNRENLTDHYNALMEEILHVIFDDRRRGSEDRVVRRLQYIANEMLNDWLQTIFHTEDNWPVHHRMHAFYPLSGGDSLTKNMQVQALNRQYDMNPNTELLPMMRRLRRDIAGNAHINIQKSEDLSVWDIFAEESRYGEVLGTLPQEACDHHDLETEDQKKEWAKEIFLDTLDGVIDGSRVEEGEPIFPSLPQTSSRTATIDTDARIKEMLGEWRMRPDILEIARLVKEGGLTDDNIKDIGKSMPELSKFADPIMEKTLQELDNLFPYYYQIVDHLLKKYPEHKFIFAGRAAETMYDIMRLVLARRRRKNRAVLFPASGVLLYSCLFSLNDLDRPGLPTKEDVKALFENVGIDEETIKRKDPYLIIDTAYEGSNPKLMHVLMTYLFTDTRMEAFDTEHPDQEIKKQFAPKMIKVNPGAYAEKLLDFQISSGERDLFVKALSNTSCPVTRRDWNEDPGEAFAKHMAISMNTLPRYHDPFLEIIDVDGVKIGIPLERGKLRKNIDKLKGSGSHYNKWNDNIINPVAAMIVQKHIAEKTMSTWEATKKPRSARRVSTAPAPGRTTTADAPTARTATVTEHNVGQILQGLPANLQHKDDIITAIIKLLEQDSIRKLIGLKAVEIYFTAGDKASRIKFRVINPAMAGKFHPADIDNYEDIELSIRHATSWTGVYTMIGPEHKAQSEGTEGDKLGILLERWYLSKRETFKTWAGGSPTNAQAARVGLLDADNLATSAESALASNAQDELDTIIADLLVFEAANDGLMHLTSNVRRRLAQDLVVLRRFDRIYVTAKYESGNDLISHSFKNTAKPIVKSATKKAIISLIDLNPVIHTVQDQGRNVVIKCVNPDDANDVRIISLHEINEHEVLFTKLPAGFSISITYPETYHSAYQNPNINLGFEDNKAFEHAAGRLWTLENPLITSLLDWRDAAEEDARRAWDSAFLNQEEGGARTATTRDGGLERLLTGREFKGSGKTDFLFESHFSIEETRKKAKEKIGVADIIIFEYPYVEPKVYRGISAGTISVEEGLAALREKWGCSENLDGSSARDKRYLMFAPVARNTFELIHGTNKLVLFAPNDQPSSQAMQYMNAASSIITCGIEEFLFTENPGIFAETVEAGSRKYAASFTERDESLKDFIRKIRRLAPEANVFILRGAGHTEPHIALRKEWGDPVSRDFTIMPYLFTPHAEMIRRIIFDKPAEEKERYLLSLRAGLYYMLFLGGGLGSLNYVGERALASQISKLDIEAVMPGVVEFTKDIWDEEDAGARLRDWIFGQSDEKARTATVRKSSAAARHVDALCKHAKFDSRLFRNQTRYHAKDYASRQGHSDIKRHRLTLEAVQVLKHRHVDWLIDLMLKNTEEGEYRDLPHVIGELGEREDLKKFLEAIAFTDCDPDDVVMKFKYSVRSALKDLRHDPDRAPRDIKKSSLARAKRALKGSVDEGSLTSMINYSYKGKGSLADILKVEIPYAYDYDPFMEGVAKLDNTFCVNPDISLAIIISSINMVARDEEQFRLCIRAVTSLLHSIKVKKGLRDDFMLATLPAIAKDAGDAEGFIELIGRERPGPKKRNFKRWVASSTGYCPDYTSVTGIAFHEVYYVPVAAPYKEKARRWLILDFDETLVKGTIDEVGIEGLDTKATKKFQEYIKYLKEKRGVTLALASRNQEEVLKAAFDAHPEMLLKWNDFAVKMVNLNDKASNIAAFIKGSQKGPAELRVPAYRIIFMDDNRDVRAQVREMLPEVLVPEPHPERIPDGLYQVDSVFPKATTKEAKARPESFTALEALVKEASGIPKKQKEGYYHSLNVQAGFSEARNEDITRIAELVNGTNQFNLANSRCTAEDIKRYMQDDDYRLFVFHMRNRKVDFGRVGFIMLHRTGPGIWEIDTFCFSCRAMAVNVSGERSFLAAVIRHLNGKKAKTIHGIFKETADNKGASQFYKSMGFKKLPKKKTGPALYKLDLPKAPKDIPWIKIMPVKAYLAKATAAARTATVSNYAFDKWFKPPEKASDELKKDMRKWKRLIKPLQRQGKATDLGKSTFEFEFHRVVYGVRKNKYWDFLDSYRSRTVVDEGASARRKEVCDGVGKGINQGSHDDYFGDSYSSKKTSLTEEQEKELIGALRLYARSLKEEPTARTATTESKRRIEQYRNTSKRIAKNKRGEPLKISAYVTVDDPSTAERVAELTQSASQFNLVNIRFNKYNINRMIKAHDYKVFALATKDRDGSDGVVAAMIVNLHNHVDSIGFAGEILSFCKSRKARHLPIERPFMQFVLREVAKCGNRGLLGHYLETEDNNDVKDLYRDLGFEPWEYRSTLASWGGRFGGVDIWKKDTQNVRLNPSNYKWLKEFVVCETMPEWAKQRSDKVIFASENRLKAVLEWLEDTVARWETEANKAKKGSLLLNPDKMLADLNESSNRDEEFIANLTALTGFLDAVHRKAMEGKLNAKALANAIDDAIPSTLVTAGKYPGAFRAIMGLAEEITEKYDMVCCPLLKHVTPQLFYFANQNPEIVIKAADFIKRHPYLYRVIDIRFAPYGGPRRDAVLPYDRGDALSTILFLALTHADDMKQLEKCIAVLSFMTVRLRLQRITEGPLLGLLTKGVDENFTKLQAPTFSDRFLQHRVLTETAFAKKGKKMMMDDRLYGHELDPVWYELRGAFSEHRVGGIQKMKNWYNSKVFPNGVQAVQYYEKHIEQMLKKPALPNYPEGKTIVRKVEPLLAAKEGGAAGVFAVPSISVSGPAKDELLFWSDLLTNNDAVEHIGAGMFYNIDESRFTIKVRLRDEGYMVRLAADHGRDAEPSKVSIAIEIRDNKIKLEIDGESREVRTKADQQRCRDYYNTLRETSHWDEGVGIGFSYPLTLEEVEDLKAKLEPTKAARTATTAQVAKQAEPPRVKVIIVDADNVLWGKAIADYGVEGIVLGSRGPGKTYRDIQRRLKHLQEDMGVLLVLCSRNNRRAIMSAFKHPDMVLTKDNFVSIVPVTGKKRKSEAIRETLSKDGLNLNPRHTAFLDDSSSERLDVISDSKLSTIYVPDLGKDPKEYLGVLGEIEGLVKATGATTAEAKRRTKLYRTMFQRNARIKKQGRSNVKLEAYVTVNDPATYDRVAELTQRTNQFNLNAKRLTKAKIEAMAQKGDCKVYALATKDRHGLDGIVSTIIAQKTSKDTWDLASFCKSCRLNLIPLEDFFAGYAAKDLAQSGAKTITASYLPTKDNQDVADLYGRLGFTKMRKAKKTQKATIWKAGVSSIKRSRPKWLMKLVPCETMPEWAIPAEELELSNDKRTEIGEAWIDEDVARWQKSAKRGLKLQPVPLLQSIDRCSAEDKGFRARLKEATGFLEAVNGQIVEGNFNKVAVANALDEALPAFTDAVGSHMPVYKAALRWTKAITVKHGIVCCPLFTHVMPELVEYTSGDEEMAVNIINALKSNHYLYRVITLGFKFKRGSKEEVILPNTPAMTLAGILALALAYADENSLESIENCVAILCNGITRLRLNGIRENELVRELIGDAMRRRTKRERSDLIEERLFLRFITEAVASRKGTPYSKWGKTYAHDINPVWDDLRKVFGRDEHGFDLWIEDELFNYDPFLQDRHKRQIVLMLNSGAAAEGREERRMKKTIDGLLGASTGAYGSDIFKTASLRANKAAQEGLKSWEGLLQNNPRVTSLRRSYEGAIDFEIKSKKVQSTIAEAHGYRLAMLSGVHFTLKAERKGVGVYLEGFDPTPTEEEKQRCRDYYQTLKETSHYDEYGHSISEKLSRSEVTELQAGLRRGKKTKAKSKGKARTATTTHNISKEDFNRWFDVPSAGHSLKWWKENLQKNGIEILSAKSPKGKLIFRYGNKEYILIKSTVKGEGKPYIIIRHKALLVDESASQRRKEICDKIGKGMNQGSHDDYFGPSYYEKEEELPPAERGKLATALSKLGTDKRREWARTATTTIPKPIGDVASRLNKASQEIPLLNMAVSQLAGMRHRPIDATKLALCIPYEAFINSVDLARLSTEMGELNGNLNFELVITGVKDKDVGPIDRLNDADIKEALRLTEDFTVTIIRENEIRSELGQNDDTPKTRIEAIRRLHPLATGECMAIATDPVGVDEAEDVEIQLQSCLSKNLSIRVLSRQPDDAKSLYSISAIAADWLYSIQEEKRTSTIKTIPALPIPEKQLDELDILMRRFHEALAAV